MKLPRGYVHIYTGNGKGKTTAAFGLALRAAGAGLNVAIIQFVKKGAYSEVAPMSRLKNVIIEQYGTGCFIRKKPSQRDKDEAGQAFARACSLLRQATADVLILDEIGIALHYGLVTPEAVLTIIKDRPEKTELVLTGRRIPKNLYRYAHLITEMVERKHYYKKGVQARKGIEC